MKKQNSVSEFVSERNEVLVNHFHRKLKEGSDATVRRLFHDVAAQPAPRFWVSECRAAVVVMRLLKGEENLEGMYEEKREMYKEIIRRYQELRRLRPDDSVMDIVFDVVNQPAPHSYLSWQRTRTLVYGELKRRQRERLQKRRAE